MRRSDAALAEELQRRRAKKRRCRPMSDSRPYAVVPYPPPVGLRAKLLLALHRALEAGLRFERRLEPFFRRGFNRAFREPLAALLQYLINRRRPNEGLELAEERIDPDEPESLASITAAFGGYMERAYRPGTFERGGNTKTHGIVRAEVIVRDDLPAHLRHGVFATPRSFPAFVRFSGPGPNLPPDIADVGFGSMTMKLMDVPGPKLMDDEKFTQDFLTVSTPSFVTPNTRENAKLQWLELSRDAGVLFPQSVRFSPARFLHAGPVERDAVQSPGHPLLELRSLPSR